MRNPCGVFRCPLQKCGECDIINAKEKVGTSGTDGGVFKLYGLCVLCYYTKKKSQKMLRE